MGVNPRDFEAIVGAEHVETGGRPLDAVLPVASVRPGSADEVAAVLRVAGEQGAVVVVRGGGSKLAWGNPLAADAFISLETARLVEPVDLRPDEGIATLGAGLRLAALAEAAADCENIAAYREHRFPLPPRLGTLAPEPQ